MAVQLSGATLFPTRIEELLEQQKEFGTHPIIDFTCISQKSKRKAIAEGMGSTGSVSRRSSKRFRTSNRKFCTLI